MKKHTSQNKSIIGLYDLIEQIHLRIDTLEQQTRALRNLLESNCTDDYLNSTEVCKQLKISKSTLYRLRSQNKIAKIKIGNRYLYPNNFRDNFYE